MKSFGVNLVLHSFLSFLVAANPIGVQEHPAATYEPPPSSITLSPHAASKVLEPRWESIAPITIKPVHYGPAAVPTRTTCVGCAGDDRGNHQGPDLLNYVVGDVAKIPMSDTLSSKCKVITCRAELCAWPDADNVTWDKVLNANTLMQRASNCQDGCGSAAFDGFDVNSGAIVYGWVQHPHNTPGFLIPADECSNIIPLPKPTGFQGYQP